ncbi:conserved hypothetical protein [Streptomyces himastatinicus ATCC 53653]|uniref:Uncharacterized protein n=1 Tax=Streptomyces himastatinicus ATCC 53653 TaxID=457427 RepID=D9W647_9ACTN|nr:hypothetical protein [Streptomyces himastatinicus]EFL20403.1 conserved hypothetical protein [Streptomyces himastatinicus ATCC 53653]
MSTPAIDEAPLSGFHRKLTWACAGGPFLDGYLLSIIGVALVGMSNELQLTTGDESLIGADYPIATSLLAEWVPNRHRGRLLGPRVPAVAGEQGPYRGRPEVDPTGPGAHHSPRRAARGIGRRAARR